MDDERNADSKLDVCQKCFGSGMEIIRGQEALVSANARNS
jgi:hypothetical protein